MSKDIQTNQQFQTTLIDRYYLKCIRKIGFKNPTPIQFYSLKQGLNKQESLICQSKSGTGKTLSYLTLILTQLFNLPHQSQLKNFLYSIILVPTRELAIQVYQNLRQILQSKQGIKPQDQKQKNIKIKMKSIKLMLAIGGIPFQDDKKKYIQHGAHIIVGTIGRVHQLYNKGIINFDHLICSTLDQADKLWESKNQSFQELIKILKNHRLFLFSATYSSQIIKQVKQSTHNKFIFIKTLAVNDKMEVNIMRNQNIMIKDQQQNNLMTLQNIHKFQINIDFSKSTIFHAKIKALINILTQIKFKKCLIFVQKKALLSQISQRLNSFQHVLIHGSLTQASRIKLMNKMNDSRIILSSDLLARGIDFVLDLVILFDAKQNDTFWHRIGRTGRFGRSGVAISLDNIQWQEYQKDKINGILNNVVLQQKKEYYGKYLCQLSEWAEVNDEAQKQLTKKYKYFDQNQFQENLKNKLISQKMELSLRNQQQDLFLFSKDKQEMQEIPQQFQDQQQFNIYISKILNCQQCVKLMESTQQLTEYKFQILKYKE